MSLGTRFMTGCLVASIAVGGALAANSPEDSAQAAAESWLRLVDAGDYSASWAHAAAALKGAVPQAEWSRAAGALRAPLGKVVSRRVTSRQYSDKGPTTRVIGGKVYTWSGHGKCVTIEYHSVFANKPSAIETIIPVPDSDGAWRVSGYSVR